MTKELYKNLRTVTHLPFMKRIKENYINIAT